MTSARAPQVFATRVWGFEPDLWPVASFGSDGICRNLIAQSEPGDILVFVGTKGAPTQAHEQGRILGYARFGRDVVDTLSVLRAEDVRPEAYDETGQFRWPRAMVLTQAWRIAADPLPDLVETIGRQLPRMATTYAVPLSDEEGRAVLSLSAAEEVLRGTERFERLRLKSDRLQGRSTGPRPHEGARRAGVQASDGPAFTYAFRFGQTDCFKIGWSHDPAARLKDINTHVPVEVTGAAWMPYLQQEWQDGADAAYDMEQRVLDLLPQDRIIGERFQIARDALDSIWLRAFMAA